MNRKDEENLETVKKIGVGIGTAIAIVISYDLYHNVFWAFLHGILGWFYIIYFLLVLNK